MCRKWILGISILRGALRLCKGGAMAHARRLRYLRHRVRLTRGEDAGPRASTPSSDFGDKLGRRSSRRHQLPGRLASDRGGAHGKDRRSSASDNLVGREVETMIGRPNRILRVDSEAVLVETNKSPAGQPVPIRWVQGALDRLVEEGDVEISVASVGFAARS
jgi:hypothetical protein